MKMTKLRKWLDKDPIGQPEGVELAQRVVNTLDKTLMAVSRKEVGFAELIDRMAQLETDLVTGVEGVHYPATKTKHGEKILATYPAGGRYPGE